jgi:hypothetical protein
VRTAEAGGRSLWNQHDVALAAHWSDTLARRGPDRCVAELQMFDEILWLPPGSSRVPIAERLTREARDLIPSNCPTGPAQGGAAPER